jgi:AbrB family looped-hinge helix DNA binding protein
MVKTTAYSSSLSSKGQVTIPLEIRHRLGLVAGDKVEFAIEGDQTVIRPLRSEENPFEKYVGILGSFPGGEEGIKKWVSDMRDDDEE